MSEMKPIVIIGILLALLTGCKQYDGVENDECAELSFRIATASIGSRGNVTDYPTTPANWTQAERAVDGRYMYNLSVYIVNNENRIVASQEGIVIDGQATEYTVTFDKSYGLKRGIYKLLAVANNAALTIAGKTYNSGLVRTWDSSDYESLINNMIGGNATDNVSSREVVQPLSLMKDIELHAGNNTVEGELVRTFARIRIEVKNNSGVLPLKIKNLTFSNNFTQKQAYVFDDGTERKYFDPTAAPRSTSSYALQPFTTDTGSDAKTIVAQSSGVIFDSYLLESKISASERYTYTIDFEYESGYSSVLSYKPTWNTYIGQVSNLSVGAESYFLIYNSNNTTRYLSAGISSVTTAQLSQNSATVSTSDVWQLISTGIANQYYIKNVETGLYMQTPSNNSLSLGSTPVAFTFETKEAGYDWYRYYYINIKSNNKYISVSSNGTVKSANNSSSSETNFRMYVVNKVEEIVSGSSTITYNTPIVLTTIDPVTQQSSPATAIKRNDFINVLVTVSYNPESGTFEFFVDDWNEGGGSVEFE